MITYYSRLKVSRRAGTQLAIQFNSDRQYWKEVLKRIIAVIKFVAS
jgi:sorbitol-specific phosphotransferase system component IIBC